MKLLRVAECSEKFATRMLYAILVREDPLAGRDHVARPRDAAVVHDVERDEVRLRRRARVAVGRAGGDAGHERAVAAAVAGASCSAAS